MRFRVVALPGSARGRIGRAAVFCWAAPAFLVRIVRSSLLYGFDAISRGGEFSFFSRPRVEPEGYSIMTRYWTNESTSFFLDVSDLDIINPFVRLRKIDKYLKTLTGGICPGCFRNRTNALCLSSLSRTKEKR